MGLDLTLRPFPASGYSEYWTARRRKGLYFKGFTTRHGPPDFELSRELLTDSTPASQIQFPLRFDEFLDRKFDLFAGVGGRYLGADARFTVGYDRIRKRDDVDALAEQKLRHAGGHDCIAEHDRHDGMLARQHVESGAGHLRAEVAGVLA